MVRLTTRLPVALLAAAFTGTIMLSAVSEAEAGPKHRKGYHGKHYKHGGYKHRRHGYRGGEVLGAGIAGFLIGSLVAPPVYAVQPYYAPPTVIYEPPPVAYSYPEPVYTSPPIYPAPPVYSEGYRRPYSEYERYEEYEPYNGKTGSIYKDEQPPKVLTYEDTVGQNSQIAGTEPGSPAWFEYCRARFRSFDEQTGTYLGYDGKRHLCVVR
ncbi:MAG: BA14K family protein [Pseudomonadota bacterium]